MPNRLPQNRRARLLSMIGIDVGVVALAYIAALVLRFDGDPPTESWLTLLAAFPLIALVYILSNWFTGIYHTAWQYGGVPDVLNLARSVIFATILILVVNVFVPERNLPLSVNLVAAAFAFIGMGASKLWSRLMAGSWGQRAAGRRVLIVGAGNTGQLLAREFLERPAWHYHPVAFLDDDERKVGSRIHGVPVAGVLSELSKTLEEHGVELVAIALPSTSGTVIRDVIATCQAHEVQVRMVPSLPEIVRGPAKTVELREVTVEDLLSRAPVEVDYSLCSASVRGRNILITGGAGSIGAELARQVLTFHPLSLIVLDNNESGLHDLQLELAGTAGSTSVSAVVADITDRPRLSRVVEETRPALIFHAAAYKHVPLMEQYPEEAFRVNVLGTLNVIDAALACGAAKLVFVSSDKAVNPASVLGATKRIGERLIAAYANGSDTVMCAVRFGNVIGSRGSVVPTFWHQIERGGPVSITDPDASRYFLTVPEAVSLVIQAAAFARQGQTYILDMGEEVKIVQLAEKMIRLRGLKPYRDIPIVFTGLRPGEKTHEELLDPGETTQPTSHPKVLLVEANGQPDRRWLVGEIHRLADEGARDGALVAQLHTLAGNRASDSDQAPPERARA